MQGDNEDEQPSCGKSSMGQGTDSGLDLPQDVQRTG
jgi:hypothetical protein